MADYWQNLDIKIKLKSLSFSYLRVHIGKTPDMIELHPTLPQGEGRITEVGESSNILLQQVPLDKDDLLPNATISSPKNAYFTQTWIFLFWNPCSQYSYGRN